MRSTSFGSVSSEEFIQEKFLGMYSPHTCSASVIFVNFFSSSVFLILILKHFGFSQSTD